MLSADDFSEMVKNIESDDSFTRGLALYVLWHTNVQDERMLPYFEKCLVDTSLCKVSGAPFEYSEVRYVAAHALATLRRNLGIQEPVRLQNIVKPLEMGDILVLGEREGLTHTVGNEGLKELFLVLRDRNKLPTIDLELDP